MARQHLTKEQKDTITQMAADGHTVGEIAVAVGKWPATVRHFVNGNIFEIRELEGKMPDGTPKAGREAGGQCAVAREEERVAGDQCAVASDQWAVGSDQCTVSRDPHPSPAAPATPSPLPGGKASRGKGKEETDQCASEESDEIDEAEGLEPWAVWLGKRMDAIAAEIGKRLGKGLWIDAPMVAEWNRHVDEIEQQKILRGIEK